MRRFVAYRHPAAEAALLTGSQARGQAAGGSDYDVVLLFRFLPEGAWREMVLFEGRHIEVFAHDPGTMAYFCRELDRASGIPALPAMVAEGISALPGSSPLLDIVREVASEVLRLGPRQLDSDDMRMRRYAITDLAAALQRDRDSGLVIAAAAALYTALADFSLRAAGRWSASGKAVPKALRAMDAALAARFEASFNALFAAGDFGPIQALVDAVLRPHGGRLREGFRRAAPAEWRDGSGAELSSSE